MLSSPLVSLGLGLPAIPAKLLQKIKANHYIDFAELPPAKGKNHLLPQSLEGQLVVVQAVGLTQGRRLIPDLAVCPVLLLVCCRSSASGP